MAVLPEASFAVTVNENEVPAVVEVGTELRTRLEAEAGFTVMLEEVTEREPSDAVRVREPAVLRVMLKDPTPLVSDADEGRVALESLEEIATVPE